MIYIAGKITGERVSDCYEKFKRGSLEAEEISGMKAINPLELAVEFGMPYKECIGISFEALKKCKAIYMLDDWRKSNGAIVEHRYAENNNLEIYYQ